MRFWKVPKRRSILPLACGLGATRWETAQGGESALELGAGIPAIGGGLMAEQGQAIGIKSDRDAVEGKSPAEVLEVVPSGVGGDKDGGQEFARVVIHRQQEGLLIGGGPPLMDGGIMLPEFTHTGPFPAATDLRSRWKAKRVASSSATS